MSQQLFSNVLLFNKELAANNPLRKVLGGRARHERNPLYNQSSLKHCLAVNSLFVKPKNLSQAVKLLDYQCYIVKPVLKFPKILTSILNFRVKILTSKEFKCGNSLHMAKTKEMALKQSLQQLRNPQTQSANSFTTVAREYKFERPLPSLVENSSWGVEGGHVCPSLLCGFCSANQTTCLKDSGIQELSASSSHSTYSRSSL